MEATIQYDAFAAEYDWIFSDPTSIGERRLDEFKPVLESLPGDGAVLDCACGIGLPAIPMARHGYHVTGTA